MERDLKTAGYIAEEAAAKLSEKPNDLLFTELSYNQWGGGSFRWHDGVQAVFADPQGVDEQTVSHELHKLCIIALQNTLRRIACIRNGKPAGIINEDSCLQWAKLLCDRIAIRKPLLAVAMRKETEL